jgi:hypothetical protein
MFPYQLFSWLKEDFGMLNRNGYYFSFKIYLVTIKPGRLPIV